jgi:hypothetical protein
MLWLLVGIIIVGALAAYRAGRIVLLSVALAGGFAFYSLFSMATQNMAAMKAQEAAVAPAREALKLDCAAIRAKHAGDGHAAADWLSLSQEMKDRGCQNWL